MAKKLKKKKKIQPRASQLITRSSWQMVWSLLSLSQFPMTSFNDSSTNTESLVPVRPLASGRNSVNVNRMIFLFVFGSSSAGNLFDIHSRIKYTYFHELNHPGDPQTHSDVQ